MLMSTNPTHQSKLLYPELSFKIVGVLYKVHNEIGPYAKENNIEI